MSPSATPRVTAPGFCPPYHLNPPKFLIAQQEPQPEGSQVRNHSLPPHRAPGSLGKFFSLGLSLPHLRSFGGKAASKKHHGHKPTCPRWGTWAGQDGQAGAGWCLLPDLHSPSSRLHSVTHTDDPKIIYVVKTANSGGRGHEIWAEKMSKQIYENNIQRYTVTITNTFPFLFFQLATLLIE